MAPARLEQRLQAVVASPTPYEVVHKTRYRVHERVAEHFVCGRIMLAGDAAHLNNPLGGMGMNGGIHDAINLSEKLSEIWRGADWRCSAAMSVNAAKWRSRRCRPRRYAIVKYSMSATRPDAEPIMTICELPLTIRFVTNSI